MLAERTGAKIRKSLESYIGVLPAVRLDALGDRMLIMTYSLWAFQIREAPTRRGRQSR